MYGIADFSNLDVFILFISLTDLTNDSLTVEENTLKFTCFECKFTIISKEGMDSHISLEHTLDDIEQVQ